jgi:hypothetical protein
MLTAFGWPAAAKTRPAHTVEMSHFEDSLIPLK